MTPRRVAIVSDFAEERWFSMDLVAEMLTQHLARDHSGTVEAVKVCPKFVRLLSHVPIIGKRRTASSAERFINRFVNYPRWLRKHRTEFDLFHVVDHSYGELVHYLPPERTVVTCHDLDAFNCLLKPEHNGHSALAKWAARRNLDGLRQAAKVSCNSHFTRNQLLWHGLVPAERTSVVHLGVHPDCSPQPDASADTLAARLLRSDNGGLIEILHVGSTMRRKRIDLLMRIFHALKGEFPDARLVRVGGPFTAPQAETARKLGIADSISILPFLSPRLLAAVYRRATILLVTSEAEGFGLPVIEAMGCGTPVVATDLGSLREVGGDAAVYCENGNIEAWTSTVAEVLHERATKKKRWSERRSACRRQAAKFSWSESAARTVDLYRQLAT